MTDDELNRSLRAVRAQERYSRWENCSCLLTLAPLLIGLLVGIVVLFLLL